MSKHRSGADDELRAGAAGVPRFMVAWGGGGIYS